MGRDTSRVSKVQVVLGVKCILTRSTTSLPVSRVPKSFYHRLELGTSNLSIKYGKKTGCIGGLLKLMVHSFTNVLLTNFLTVCIFS